MQSFVVAVVIPEKKEIQSYAKQNGISGEYSDLLQNDQVWYAVGDVLHKHCPLLCLKWTAHGCTQTHHSRIIVLFNLTCWRTYFIWHLNTVCTVGVTHAVDYE